MANRQTRALAKVGRGTRVVKGAQSPVQSNNGSYAVLIDRPRARGACVNSYAERVKSGRKPWMGVPGARRKEGVKRYAQY